MSELTEDETKKAQHPSKTLRKWISEGYGLKCDKHDTVVSRVWAGEDVDESNARQLGCATGVTASFWLNLQQQYEEANGDD